MLAGRTTGTRAHSARNRPADQDRIWGFRPGSLLSSLARPPARPERPLSEQAESARIVGLMATRRQRKRKLEALPCSAF